MSLTSAEIIRLLHLQSATCGFVRESFKSDVQMPASILPPGYAGDHVLGNVLYFLVTPDAPVRLHRIRSDQMYHHYLGDPLEVLLLYADGRHEVKRVGSDLSAGIEPQLFIPGGTYHAARVSSSSGYALLGTSIWVRAEPTDVQMGNPELLEKSFPSARSQIADFAGLKA
jgi:uncharacterized protein